MQENKNKIQIEAVSSETLVEVLPLFVNYMEFYEKPIDEDKFLKYFQSIIDRDSVFIYKAVVEDKPAGLMVVYRTLSSFECGEILFLNDLWVEPSYRASGVGQSLMNEVISLGKELGCKRIDLMTNLTNEPARSLYEKNGMLPDKEFINYSLWLQE